MEELKPLKIEKIYKGILFILIAAIGIFLLHPHYGEILDFISDQKGFITESPSSVEASEIKLKLVDKRAPEVVLEDFKSETGKIAITFSSDKVLKGTEKLKSYNLKEISNDENGKIVYQMYLPVQKTGVTEFPLKFENEYSVISNINFLLYKSDFGPNAEITVLSPLPESVQISRKDADSMLAPVSKSYYLQNDYEASDLVDLSKLGIKEVYAGQMLRKEAGLALSEMYSDMKSQGIDMAVSSSYRSYQTQITTYSFWLGHNSGSLSAADRVSARPGHSEHQLGTTVDIVSSETNYKLTENFAYTNSAKWLAANSYKYGFVLSYPEGKQEITGYKFEPWHFRYIGKEKALLYKESGLTLIQYLEKMN